MKVKENAELLQALEGRNYGEETFQAIIESLNGKCSWRSFGKKLDDGRLNLWDLELTATN